MTSSILCADSELPAEQMKALKSHDWSSSPQIGCRPDDNLKMAPDLFCDVEQGCAKCPRVALLTPYNGGNLGDAAIQDAMIANLRLRIPNVQFSGVTLDDNNFKERHGTSAFPLCTTDRPFYGMSSDMSSYREESGGEAARIPNRKLPRAFLTRASLKRVPLLGWCLKAVRAAWRELRHCIRGYRFLRAQDLLIVSGGGQLDERWGGPWGHPYTLFKWAILARIAQVPYAIASVGLCKVTSKTSRMFLAAALRISTYRSYRDKHSKAFAASLLRRASNDAVVPDLALGLTSRELARPEGVRSGSQEGAVVAISPIAFAKPGSWPFQDRALYERYLHQMTRVVSLLLERGYRLEMVSSELGGDKCVIAELLDSLSGKAKAMAAQRVRIPRIQTWKELVASLRDADFLVASRLHSAILGFVAQTPTVAISFDPKVDWLMEDVGQAEYLLHISTFVAEDVIQALDDIKPRRTSVRMQVDSYRNQILASFNSQYDVLAELALADSHNHD